MTGDLLSELVAKTLAELSDESPSLTLQKCAKNFETHPNYSVQILEMALSEIESFGPIQDLISAKDVSEILINGPDKIYFERGGSLYRHSRNFSSTLTLKRLTGRLLLEMEKVADKRFPLVDGSLRDGSRVHMAFPPVVSSPSVCIRKHSFINWSLNDLIRMKMITAHEESILRACLVQKKNILVCGATSSGKTTLLRALLHAVPVSERIITIEDTPELSLDRPEGVSLFTREDTEGLVPDVTLNKLLKNALRMRPDRIVVGEVRDGEALTLLDALSTGHAGSMSSLHAGNAAQALTRLEGLVSRAAPQWSIGTIRQLIHDSIDIVIVLEKQNGLRKISQAVEISGVESFGFLLDPLFHVTPTPLSSWEHSRISADHSHRV